MAFILKSSTLPDKKGVLKKGWETIMKKSLYVRLGAMFVAFAAALLLIACGGGGGDTASSSSETGTTSIGGTTTTPGGSGATTACANGATTADCIFRYTDLVIMIDSGGRKNLSTLGTSGGLSVGGSTDGCEVHIVTATDQVFKAPDGRPIFECASSATRSAYALNPDTRTLSLYTGAAPTGTTKRSVQYGAFGTSPYNSCAVGNPFGMSVEKGGKLYFFNNTSNQLREVAQATAVATACIGATTVPNATVQFVAKVSN